MKKYEVYHNNKYVLELHANNQDEAERAAVELLAPMNIPTKDYKYIEVRHIYEEDKEKEEQ